jgi:hypothetical protein
MAVSKDLRFFFAASIPFGVAMAAARLEHMPASYAVGTGIVFGGLFGGLALWFRKRAVQRLMANGINPRDMSPYQSGSTEVNGTFDEVFQSCGHALRGLHKVKVLQENPQTGELVGRFPMGFTQSGQNIYVKVTGSGNRYTVTIESKPTFDTVVTDNGMSVEHVALFLNALRIAPNRDTPNKSLERSREA